MMNQSGKLINMDAIRQFVKRRPDRVFFILWVESDRKDESVFRITYTSRLNKILAGQPTSFKEALHYTLQDFGSGSFPFPPNRKCLRILTDEEVAMGLL